MRKFFLSLIIVGLLSGNLIANAFSIKPSQILLTIDPGKTKIIPIEIINNENKDLIFKGKVFGVRQTSDGKPEFINDYSQAENWVISQTDEVSVKAGNTGVLNFSIKIPNETIAGSYFLGLAVEPSSSGGSVGLSGQIITLLNLQVSGTVNESLKIDKWEIDNIKSNKNNWNFKLDLVNNGQMDLLMNGKMIVKNWSGQKLSQEKLLLGNRLLPNTFRFVRPQLDLAKNSIVLPGLYMVQTEIEYGKTKQSISSTTFVWYWPLWSKILIGFVGLFFTILVIVFVRKIKSKKRHKS